MSMPALFKGRLSIPVIGSPLFIISVPDLVIAQCKAGVVGAFPALNARPAALLDEWMPIVGGSEVNGFKGVVSESCDEEAVAFGINREMIEAAFDSRQRDGLNEFQRRHRSGNGETKRGQQKESEGST